MRGAAIVALLLLLADAVAIQFGWTPPSPLAFAGLATSGLIAALLAIADEIKRAT